MNYAFLKKIFSNDYNRLQIEFPSSNKSYEIHTVSHIEIDGNYAVLKYGTENKPITPEYFNKETAKYNDSLIIKIGDSEIIDRVKRLDKGGIIILRLIRYINEDNITMELNASKNLLAL